MSAGIVSLLLWSYLALFRGGFWRIGRFRIDRLEGRSQQTGPDTFSVAAVIPARDEADVISGCIRSLLEQNAARVQVFLVDDGSSDGTAEVARRAAAESGRAEQLTVIQGAALPRGWSGKLWAVRQGIEKARSFNPDYLLLTDADIMHAPDDLLRLARMARRGQYDLVSLMVRLNCQTFAERMLIPPFVFFFFKLYPPAWVADKDRRIAGAAGGCMLVRPQALERAGGIESIRQEIIDDCALARRIKNSGGRIWLGIADGTKSIRPYGSFAEIGQMISRNAFNQLRHSALLLALSLAGLAMVYLLPPALLFFHKTGTAALGGAAWLLMAICFVPTVRYYRLSPMWALLLPLSALFYMGATVHSAAKFWTGKGGQWKGRVQDPAGGHG
ncbi:MAG TPA: glycosyltransferase [Candidatus Limnocylindrales bacterium]|nr:glycosyltransferase [Candidatus Limnocylindrales bacterium]